MTVFEYTIIIFFFIFQTFFLVIAYYFIKNLKSKRTNFSAPHYLKKTQLRVKKFLTSEKNRYLALLCFLGIWWPLSEASSYLINLIFEPALHNQELQSLSLFTIIFAKCIAQVLSFIFAATLIKLFTIQMQSNNN